MALAVPSPKVLGYLWLGTGSAYHHCHTSGAERSRELFTIFRCVIHQCNAEWSGDGRMVQGTFVIRSGAEPRTGKEKYILQCWRVIVTRSGTVRGTGNGERINFLNLAMSKSFTLKHCDAERSGAGNGERIKYCNFAMWKCFTLQHCDAERKCTNLQRSGAGYGEIILQWGSALTFNIVTRTGASGTGDGTERIGTENQTIQWICFCLYDCQWLM
jgi:hypothetical protein